MKRRKLHEFVSKLGKKNDPVTLFISLHLQTENWIDRLIEDQCPSKLSKKILGSSTSYTYAVKLTIVYAMRLIPEGLFRNLTILNKIRNGYAHSLDYDFRTEALRFIDANGETLDRSSLKTEAVFGTMGGMTLAWLSVHCRRQHGLSD